MVQRQAERAATPERAQDRERVQTREQDRDRDHVVVDAPVAGRQAQFHGPFAQGTEGRLMKGGDIGQPIRAPYVDIDKEMLNAMSQEGDRRAKFLVPSERTLDYFETLGQSMQQANENQLA